MPSVPRSKAEFFAEVKPAHIRIGDNFVRTAFGQDSTSINDIGAVRQPQGFPHIVVRNQDSDTAIGEMSDEVLNVADRVWIDAGTGLVEQHVVRIGGEGARDFNA